MSWVDAAKRLGVLANADTPEDAQISLNNGAEGIGLTRTEHMFFSSPERIAAIRRVIAAVALGTGNGA
jgi:pyruvate, orthophosphate dikinase